MNENYRPLTVYGHNNFEMVWFEFLYEKLIYTIDVIVSFSSRLI